MPMIRWIKIKQYERGFLYRDDVFQRVLRPGRHWVIDPLFRVRVVRASVRETFIESSDLDVIVRTGALGDEARVLDLGEDQRALVWVDGRFVSVLGRGLWAVWTAFRTVEVEVVETRQSRFEHNALAAILNSPTAARFLEEVSVDAGWIGLVMVDGKLSETLGAGRYAFWRDVAKSRVLPVDLREQAIDVSGQEIMTADKVTLRMNAVVTYRVVDAVKAATTVESYEQSLYREAQLALRAVVGSRELDTLLSDKDDVATELEGVVRERATSLGLEVEGLGIRDIILPGEMKTLLNRVTEARKAAEANLVTRREETAAIRSQANTARIFESNAALMRLRELEVLEKVAETSNLTVVLGENGLTDRVVKLL
ncbi:MAG: slipin family protein [Thermoanaerobaculia bacterium]|nr:slipin family protein [Thermoanaerobaculia bacterium]